MPTDVIKELARIEQSVRASDGEAILARWDFGRMVIDQREGKQLPKGLLGDICAQVGISQMEVSRRARVAEHYDRTELKHQCLSSGPTWVEVVNAIPAKRATPKRAPQQTPPRTEPTKATLVEADRVQSLVTKPDVAAEIARRAADDKAARKAQVVAERKQRDEAKAQKQHDQETQQLTAVLREQLVRSGANWQIICELLETSGDTLSRVGQLVDGLATPDPLQLKVLDRQLGKLQQAAFRLRQRMFPQYEQPSAELPLDNGVIEVADS